jgi:hypothetical protein
VVVVTVVEGLKILQSPSFHHRVSGSTDAKLAIDELLLMAGP